MAERKPKIRRHLLIAGTGRAGTSFLVSYLAELGLDTHLGRYSENPAWDEDANAGLEDLPLYGPDAALPYVIKSPWLYKFIDEILADATFAMDGVIIPVRDLVEAATSRSILEQRAILQQAPWTTRLERSWEEWAHVPGGIIYSLNPIDQGRLLAVGFHHLVQRLIAADVPIVFLAFPKLTEDPDYLFRKLRPLLPQTIDQPTACAAHRRVADPAKVRVGGELKTVASGVIPATILGYETHSAVDAIASRRELGRIRGQLEEARFEISRADEQLRAVSAAAADEAGRLNNKITKLEVALAEAAAATRQALLDKDNADGVRLEDAKRYQQEIERLAKQNSWLQKQTAVISQQKVTVESELASIRSSRSWRMTYPYRALGFRVLMTFRGTTKQTPTG